MSTLFGFVTFGGLKFTKLLVESIRRTVTNPYDIFAVVGKPKDSETAEWLDSVGITHVIHTENMGFPYSLNDIYDYAWKLNNYDNLIIAGNDVILYPYAGDSLINLANSSDYSVISALQYDVRNLVEDFPETRSVFSDSKYSSKDLSSEPWTKFTNYSDKTCLEPMMLYDIQNLCLYKREVFDKIGYTDVNFYPAYFVDNDYARRIVLSNIKCCSLTNARFFHFWSRTIHEGSGGSTSRQFENNREFYKRKWGGDINRETAVPQINIQSRDGEIDAVRYWRNKT